MVAILFQLPPSPSPSIDEKTIKTFNAESDDSCSRDEIAIMAAGLTLALRLETT